MSAPLMPAPTTTTSAVKSRRNEVMGTESPRESAQNDAPVRRVRRWVTGACTPRRNSGTVAPACYIFGAVGIIASVNVK